jgi:hypothetical protein
MVLVDRKETVGGSFGGMYRLIPGLLLNLHHLRQQNRSKPPRNSRVASTSRGATKVGYRTVDILAVKSSCDFIKKTYVVVAMLVAKSFVSDFRTARARPCCPHANLQCSWTTAANAV